MKSHLTHYKTKIFLVFLVVLSMFFILEILSCIFVTDPEIENIVTSCKEEDTSAYIEKNQCPRSQDEMAQMEYNTFVGYIPVANHSGTGWYTNSSHYRYDENLSAKKPNDEFRIFITGGSSAWGAGVKQHQTFAYLLERKLNEIPLSKKVRVIIAAAGGWVSSQERAFITNYVMEYDPDIIIMFSGWNDVYNAYTGRDFNKNQDFLFFRKAIYNARNFLKPQARLTETYQDKFENLCPPRFSEYKSKFLYLVLSVIYKYRYNVSSLLKQIKTISLDVNKIKQNTLYNIELINHLLKKEDISMIYCLQPTIYLTNKELSDWERAILIRSVETDVGYAEYNSEAYRELRVSLKDNAIKNNYLFWDCDEAIKNEKLSVFIDHVHFGDRGNMLIANFLFSKLLENDLIKKLIKDKKIN